MRPTRRVSRLSIAASMSVVLCLVPIAGVGAFTADPAAVFINEIHYDNAGADAGEAIEVAGPAGTDLTGWSIVLYNGSGGAVYGTLPLAGTIPDQDGGFGTTSITAVGLQNGSPDGIALVAPGSALVQFLSYEGGFTGVGGPAGGIASTDIVVSEAGSEAVGLSVALTGTGTTYQDFSWTAGADDSFGAPNPGQDFGAVVDEPITLTCGGAISVVEGLAGASRSITASDPDDTVVSIAIDSVVPANAGIALVDLVPAAADGGAATATLTVDTATPGTFAVTLVATNDEPADPTATCTVNVTVLAVLHVGEIQGSVADTADATTHRSPFAPATGTGLGATVAVKGVVAQTTLAVTAAGVRNYGFFLQETAEATDGDPNSSDGIFVFMNRFPDLLGGYVPEVGDEIVITARVSEFFFLTQLSSASLASLVREDVDVTTDVATFEIDPPADQVAAARYWERREGMQAQVPAGSLVQGGRSVFPGTADSEIYFYRDDYGPLADRADPYARRIFRDPHPLDDIPVPLFDNGNGFRFLIGGLGVKAIADDEFLLLTGPDERRPDQRAGRRRVLLIQQVPGHGFGPTDLRDRRGPVAQRRARGARSGDRLDECDLQRREPVRLPRRSDGRVRLRRQHRMPRRLATVRLRARQRGRL